LFLSLVKGNLMPLSFFLGSVGIIDGFSLDWPGSPRRHSS
jgi:hypothetical protein